MSDLQIKRAGAVCWLTLNRPDVHNAFNDALIADLASAFRGLAGESEPPRAVVLAGEGRSFCAGADLNWMRGAVDYTLEENLADSLRLAEMIEAVQQCPLPVVGRVHGAALGGGVGLVAACDYVLMLEGAPWGLTEVNLGLVPAAISPAVIQKIGFSRARASFLSGERYDGRRACEWGLAHEICPSVEALDQRLAELLSQIQQTGPRASRLAKELIWLNQSFGHRPEKIKDLTCQMIATQRTSPEGQEGMAALLEKRRPRWGELG